MRQWLGENPKVVATLIICVAVVLVAALLVRADLAWLPQFLRDLLLAP